MPVSRALTTSKSAQWYTPPDLLAEIRAFMGDYYDPCPADPKARENGLAVIWHGRVFCNPPYGREIGAWIRKAMTEPVEEIILLVPARTDAAWFQSLFGHSICFIRGRLKFSGATENAPFPNALVYRGSRGAAFTQAFAHRGAIVQATAIAERGLWVA